MIKGYILKNKKIYPTNDLKAIGDHLENIEQRRIGIKRIDNFFVATSFLAIDVSYEEGKQLFETMIFDTTGKTESRFYRYDTYEEAEEGHKKICREVEEYIKQKEGKDD